MAILKIRNENGEFINIPSIIGERGEQGIQGIQGERGLQGEKGDKGDVGDTGYTLTNTVRGESVTIEDAVEYKLFNLEIDGKSVQNGEPTPDTPVEIESLGYENVYNATIKQQGGSTNRLNASAFSVLPNTTYTLSTSTNNIQVNNYYKDINENNISNSTWVSLPYTFTTPENCYYIAQTIRRSDNSDVTPSDIQNVCLTKGTTVHSYIPYGKSGIEVKTVGKNLIPTNENEWEQGTITGGNNENSTTRLRTKNYIEIKENTLHTFRLENALIGNVWFYDEQKQVVNNLYDMIYQTGMKSVEFTTPKNTKYYKVVIRYEDNSVITSQAISEIKPMLEKGSVATNYAPYQEQTTVLQLNAPLRSLPNGVKDIAYIKNNKLYVDRYVGSVVLNGSETFNTLSNPNRLAITKAYNVVDDKQQYSTHYVWGAWGNVDYSIDVRTNGIRINNKDNLTIDEYKTWLSNNNVQVDYELATPVTEEVGDCVIYTYEGVNNIDLEANLETEFSVTYAQDMKSILKDYPSMEEIQAYVDSQLGTINEQLASLTEVE